MRSSTVLSACLLAGTFIASAAALLMPAMPALASTLTDLESWPGGGGRYTYWWNNSTKSCVRTLTSDGVIAGTKTVSASDCGYYGGGSDGKSGSGNDAAVAAAVAAAAIIGVAALSHKSHHRDDKEYQEPQGYADFERGYRDGLYNHSYENHSRSDTYSDGHRSGVDERERQQSSYRGGNSGTVDVSDLVGCAGGRSRDTTAIPRLPVGRQLPVWQRQGHRLVERAHTPVPADDHGRWPGGQHHRHSSPSTLPLNDARAGHTRQASARRAGEHGRSLTIGGPNTAKDITPAFNPEWSTA